MPFDYEPLWKQLKKKGLTQKAFSQQSGISISTLTRMRRGDYVALKVIDTICNDLHCTPNDIMQHLPTKE